VSVAAEVEQFIFGDLDTVPRDRDLLASGVVDSLRITELITFLEGRYGIKVKDDDIDAENFRSVDDIVAFVEKKRA